MVQELHTNSVFRAAERIRAKREAERTQAATPEATLLTPVTTTTQVRARLNFIPDDSMLGGMIQQALTALSRGVRWARGSIINLVV